MSDLRSSQKAQNLARIRDNQRRSRARRKEYLQELEAKLRSCEQAGIEASSEIQTAARRVLDENKKLKALLHERGVSEPELIAALGGSPERSYDQISSATTLNTLLERKITCTTASSTSAPSSSHTRAVSMPRHMPSVPPITIPAHRPTALSCCDSPSPGSIVSSMGTPPPAAYPTQFYATPISEESTTEIKSEDAQYNYPYDQSYNPSWAYSNDYNYVAEPVTYYNTSACVDAANIIRTMRSDIGPQLETDLGCRIPSQNCYLNNNVVFNMMDKYSVQHTAV